MTMRILSSQTTTNSQTSTALALADPYTTGSRAIPFNHPGALAAVAYACLIGTGGMMTHAYFEQRQSKGYDFAHITCVGRPVSVRALREPKESLAHIRSVFRPSVSELALIFGVTRQTLYNWMSGDRPAPESAERLDDLARASDVFAAAGLSPSAYLFRRKLLNGRSLADVVREGGEAEKTAQVMIAIARKEADQRATLQRHLTNRPKASPDTDELGVPMLNEGL